MNILDRLQRNRSIGLSVDRGKALPTRGRSVLTHAVAAYALVLAALAAVFLFGLAGISVARGSEDYRPYLWVPQLLVIASGVLILTTLIRAVRRWRR